MPEFVGGIKYPVPGDAYNSAYGEPQWWKDLAETAAAQIAAKADAGHSHSWAQITGKPSSFPPSSHTHSQSDVAGLGTALAGKIDQAKPIPAGPINDLAGGTYLVENPSTSTGLPSGAGPGHLVRGGDIDTYVEIGWAARRWERRRITGLWRAWVTVRSETVRAHSLTRPLGVRTETVSSRSVRIPFGVPARARAWRVVIRNANYRSNETYTGQVTLDSLAFGQPARNAAGELTSSFTAAPVLFHVDVAIANLADGWSSNWSNRTLEPGQDYMISYGYLTNADPVHLGMGGGWRTDYSPGNARLQHDGTAVATDRQPFDVRIEYVTDDGVRTDVMVGDSISAGSNASIPIYDSPIMIASRATGRAVNLHGFGGAAFGEWGNGAWANPESMKWQDVTRYGRTDRAFIMLGNNDIHAGDSLATLKANFTTLAAVLKERQSSSIIACTVTPRTAWTGTAKETVREQFNDWLRAYPAGITAVADTARAVEDSTGHAPRADYVTSDGIHFNTAGSTALAGAMLDLSAQEDSAGAASLAALTYDSGLRDIAALAGDKITGGKILLRRTGNTVTLFIAGVSPASTLGSGSTVFTVPSGFRNPTRWDGYLAAGLQAGVATTRSAFMFAAGGFGVWAHQTGDSWRLDLTWITNDPIPTTPPGSAA